MSTLELDKDEKRLLVEGSFTLPSDLSPFENSRSRRSFPACHDVARRLLSSNPQMQVDLRTRSWLSAQSERSTQRLDDSELPSSYGRLMPHQRSGSRWLWESRRAILADSQGTGKTVTSLAAARMLEESPVIICSNTKRTDWAEHVEEWLGISSAIVESSGEPVSASPHQAVILGYEAARRHARSMTPRLLIIDEAHNLRNRKTSQFKKISILARRSRSLFLLTATPIVNGADDIWSLLYMVDYHRFRGYWDFVNRFMEIQHGYFGIKVGGLKEEEEVNYWRLVQEYMLQRPKDESILPQISRKVVGYRMSGLHRELYEKLTKDDEVEYEGRLIEAVEAVSKITRLRQLALDPSLLWPGYSGPSKLDVLQRLINDHLGQAVVFTMFSRLADRASRRLGDARSLHGKVTSRRRDQLLKDFSAGRFKTLVVTHGTGGEGLNLVSADLLVFLDLNWHPAGNAQARDRIWRYGQTRDVEVVYIQTLDSIEDHVCRILLRKQPVTIESLARRLEI